jgi:hypothetical protein
MNKDLSLTIGYNKDDGTVQNINYATIGYIDFVNWSLALMVFLEPS